MTPEITENAEMNRLTIYPVFLQRNLHHDLNVSTIV